MQGIRAAILAELEKEHPREITVYVKQVDTGAIRFTNYALLPRDVPGGVKPHQDAIAQYVDTAIDRVVPLDGIFILYFNKGSE